jgi:lysophospholipase L1-like esterase
MRFDNQSGAGSARFPVNSPLVTIGDSIVAGYIGGSGAQDRAFDSVGYVYHALQFIQHRLRVPYNGNLAVSGYNQTQILNSLGAGGATLNALAPKVVINDGGTNELSSQPIANMLATEAQIRTLVLASGAVYVRVGITPRFGANALSATDETKRQVFNATIASIAADDSTRQKYVDPDFIGLTSADFADGLHPNSSGGRKTGGLIGAVLDSLVAPGSIMDAPALEAYTINPTLAGGTTTAPNWALTANTGTTGVTITASKDASDRQRLVFSGTAPASGSPSASLDQYTNVSAVGKTPPAGSVFEMVAEFEIVDAPTGINSINFLYGTSTSGYANLARGQRMLPNYGAPVTEVSVGLYRSRCPVISMGSGVPPTRWGLR